MPDNYRRRAVMLPTHAVPHNVRVFHEAADGSVVIHVNVTGTILASNVHKALKNSPYESVRKYYEEHKIGETLFIHESTLENCEARCYLKHNTFHPYTKLFSFLQDVTAEPAHPFVSRFEMYDDGEKKSFGSTSPMDVKLFIMLAWNTFRISSKWADEAALTAILEIDGVEKLRVNKRFMKMVDRRKVVCNEKRAIFAKHMTRKMLSRVSKYVDDVRSIGSYSLRLIPTKATKKASKA